MAPLLTVTAPGPVAVSNRMRQPVGTPPTQNGLITGLASTSSVRPDPSSSTRTGRRTGVTSSCAT